MDDYRIGRMPPSMAYNGVGTELGIRGMVPMSMQVDAASLYASNASNLPPPAPIPAGVMVQSSLNNCNNSLYNDSMVISEFGAGLPSAGTSGAGSGNDHGIISPLDVSIDFTHPDAQRTRPLVIDGRRLYVDEHYVAVWSPVLRQWCVDCPDRELIFANVSYDHVLELMFAIHPTYKDIDEQTVQILLPLAFDYQMEGLLHRCECFLITTKLPFLEKLWLADRYQLRRLLALLLRELNPNNKLDLTSQNSRYHSLSDRVKVMLLERIHGAPPPEELPELPTDMDAFLSASDLSFATIRARGGRSYHINPYYVAAWSTVFSERLCGATNGNAMLDSGDPISCPMLSYDELRYFLMAIHPPQLRITESNIGPILMASSLMQSSGMLRKCAQFLLSPQTQLSVFLRLSMIDRCNLHELLDQCLAMLHQPIDLVEMSQQQTYNKLSIQAKAAIMDRMERLVRQHGGVVGAFSAELVGRTHVCARCKTQSACSEVTWMCPQCKTYEEATFTPSGRQRSQKHQTSGGRQRQRTSEISPLALSSQSYHQTAAERAQNGVVNGDQQQQMLGLGTGTNTLPTPGSHHGGQQQHGQVTRAISQR